LLTPNRGIGCGSVLTVEVGRDNHFKVNVDRSIEETGHRPVDGGEQAVLQPVLGKGALGADDQVVVVTREGVGLLDPGVESGLSHLHLELTQGQLPELLGGKVVGR
jgi:hypothetical protein